MQKIEYEYFLYGTNILDSKLIFNAFKFGLPSRENSIYFNMVHIDATEENISNIAGSFDYNMVFVIKIPKMFLESKVYNSKLKEIPLPIWKKCIDKYYLSNQLIYGVHCRKTSTFIYNDNYTELHNPNGLMFDVLQIEYFKVNKLKRWVDFYKYRKTKDYKNLIDIDINWRLWDNALVQYQKYFTCNKYK